MANGVLSLWREPEGASGREAELSALLREREDAQAQARARFVFVKGPRGVGKSHLFSLFRRAAVAQGAVVFEAPSGREARRPFGLFAELTRELLDHAGHAGTPMPALAALSKRLAPLLGAGAPAGVMADVRVELYDAVGELMALVSPRKPVYLLPDLDAADPASLELFRFVAAVASAPESRVAGLFVASYRDDAPAPAALADVLARVEARTLPLSGLDLEGIRTYLARQAVAERLFEATGGLPDALEELLGQRSEKPVELFLRRVERQGGLAQDVLALLAVSPQALPAARLAGALGGLTGAVEAGLLAAALDALVRERMLAVRVAAGEPLYRFSREGDQRACQERSGQRAAALRRALGEELRRAGELPAAAELLLEVEPHAHGAQVAVAAADALAARGAHAEAAALYARALPHLDEAARALAHRRLSEICAAQGDFRAALGHLGRARGRGVRNVEQTAELANLGARYLVKLGRLAFAERLLRRAGEPADAALAAHLTATRVELLFLRGRPEEALALARARLPQLAASFPAQALAVRNFVGRAHLLKGELAEAEAAFSANHAGATAQGLAPLAAEAMVNLGVVAHKRGDKERALTCYTAAFEAGAARGPVQMRAHANLGSLYADAGQFELALDHLERALQAFSRLGSQRDVAQAASNLARLTLFLGELERSGELSRHALRLARENKDPYLEASALLNLGSAALDRADPAQARALLDEARGGFTQVGSVGFAAYAAALKARAHLALGERAQATAELSRPDVERGAQELSAACIEVELARGELALAHGDLLGASRAVARAREALLSQPELEGPFRVYFLSGRLKHAAGDAAGAAAEMARANRLLDELLARVPPAHRARFAAVPRRAEVLGASVEPELRLPRLSVEPAAEPSGALHGLIGRSPSLTRVVRQLQPIARSSATVLIRGESGTGKELLAEAIHQLSSRKGMPLVKVNCAAMVEELLLSELFGHERGAFTGAVRERKGRFELAEGGTLFLDEIGDITPKCQVALLRVLQEREFERVGGTRTLKVDVRVICATNRDLEALIAQGRFRQDLYYRLKGVMLELPPLRERPEDLPVLAGHFLEKVAKERRESPKRLSEDALALLAQHGWPGNVRELENVLASRRPRSPSRSPSRTTTRPRWRRPLPLPRRAPPSAPSRRWTTTPWRAAAGCRSGICGTRWRCSASAARCWTPTETSAKPRGCWA